MARALAIAKPFSHLQVTNPRSLEMNIDYLLLLYTSCLRFFKDFVIVLLMPSMVLIHVVKLNECGHECLGFRALMNLSLLI
jgi:hypothetical protein